MTPPQELREFCRLFNQEKFFEAHEVLELLWRKTQDETRDFYHGLIQISAAFVHLQKGAPKGGRELFQKAGRYLEKYPPIYRGVSLHKLIQETQKSLDQAERNAAVFPKIKVKV